MQYGVQWLPHFPASALIKGGMEGGTYFFHGGLNAQMCCC